jgi:hypothetical protein
VSKLAAGRPEDHDFVRVLLREAIVAPSNLRARITTVPSLSKDRIAGLLQMVDRLAPA